MQSSPNISAIDIIDLVEKELKVNLKISEESISWSVNDLLE